jgi:hypothetical protein
LAVFLTVLSKRRRLNPKVKVLRWANEVPKLAGDYFAQAELECHLKG